MVPPIAARRLGPVALVTLLSSTAVHAESRGVVIRLGDDDLDAVFTGGFDTFYYSCAHYYGGSTHSLWKLEKK